MKIIQRDSWGKHWEIGKLEICGKKWRRRIPLSENGAQVADQKANRERSATVKGRARRRGGRHQHRHAQPSRGVNDDRLKLTANQSYDFI